MLDARPHLAAFRLLLRDLERLLEYIEPVHGNQATYSHRTFELLLRSCTEFEALCKALLLHAGYSARPPDALTVLDFRTLEPSLRLSTVEVFALYWRPDLLLLCPFEGWATAQPPLPWYSAYNAVKHNRDTAFPLASVRTVTEALGGLFAVLATTNARHVEGWTQIDDERYTEYRCGLFAARFPRPA